MPYTVFVSHSAHDGALVQRFRVAAQPLGLRIFSFDLNVAAGGSVARKLLSQIDRCDAFVALLTKHGSDSPNVHQEIGAAIHAKKRVIQVIQPGVDPYRSALLQGVEYESLDVHDVNRTVARVAALLSVMKKERTKNRWALAAFGAFFIWSVVTRWADKLGSHTTRELSQGEDDPTG